MTSNRTYPIFELSPEDFESLCLDLLNAEGGNFALNSGGLHQGYDLRGEKSSAEGTPIKIAIAVKHRRAFDPEGVWRFIERISQSGLKFDEYIFITSSPLTPEHLQAVQSQAAIKSGLNISLVDQKEIFNLLAKHPTVGAKYFKSVVQEVRRRRIAFAFSLIGVLASVLSLFLTIVPHKTDTDRDSFQSQIQAVESNLAGLKVLERSLSALKKELQATSEESARIKLQYEEALKLKAITAEQLEQIKKAVNAQSVTDTFWNYFFGFVMGVAGSMLATIIMDRWKARRALSGP